jgi:hypothetical protein
VLPNPTPYSSGAPQILTMHQRIQHSKEVELKFQLAIRDQLMYEQRAAMAVAWSLFDQLGMSSEAASPGTRSGSRGLKAQGVGYTERAESLRSGKFGSRIDSPFKSSRDQGSRRCNLPYSKLTSPINKPVVRVWIFLNFLGGRPGDRGGEARGRGGRGEGESP